MPEITHQIAQRQISKARCLVQVLISEDAKGAGPAGLLLVDQDPAKGRVSVRNLDTVSAMLRCQCGDVVQEFGHSKLTGRLVYEPDTNEVFKMEVTVKSQEGHGQQQFWIHRQDDGCLRYRWRVEGGTEISVFDRQGELFWEGRLLAETTT